jgi:phage terminase large subunit GpA-like protein
VTYDRAFNFITGRVSGILIPPPDTTVTQWADTNRVLVRESSAETGSWKTSRTPYLRAIQDAISDRRTRKIVCMMASQLGKTEAILNAIGYFADLDPGPLMYVLPTEKLAKAYSTTRLQPMISATPVLRGKFSDQRSRDGSNNKIEKSFPGGYITMASAESPAELAGRPIRVLLMDEIDRMNNSREGDPVELALKRQTTYFNRKTILVSTPTIEGQSRIYNEFAEGTMEQWYIPCPNCDHPQIMSFWRLTNHAEPRHRCEKCDNDRYGQEKWLAMSREGGLWIPTRTHDEHRAELTTRSFQLSCLPSPWWSWSELRKEHETAKTLMERHQDASKMVSFKNTRLAELWSDDQSRKLDWEEIRDRREAYELPEGTELPEPVLLLTAGVDTQDSRLEYTVYGWCLGREVYAIEHGVLDGDTTKQEVWNELSKRVYDREFIHASGQRMKIAQSFIDAGGHRTSEVLHWCRGKSPRVYPIRGQGGKGHAIIKNRNNNNELRIPQIIVGVDGVKVELHTRFNVEEPGAAYYHYPKSKDGSDAQGFNEEYFQQLTSEKCTFRYVRGMPKEEWVVEIGKRNEAFDCAVYAFAALENFAGYTRPNDLLERLAKERQNPDTEKFVAKWMRPVPTPTTSTTPAEPENVVPRWRAASQKVFKR